MPDNVNIVLDLSEVLYKSGRFEEALGACDSALKLQPNSLTATKNRAAVLYRLNRYEEAVTEYERVIALKPGDVDAWHWKGAGLHWLERYEEAMAAYDKALKLAPDDKAIQANRDALLPGMRRTAEDQRMQVPDGRWLAYLDFGDPDGVPVFYCHGLPGSRLDMAQHESMFKEFHMRIIATDRPGYGLSTYQHRRKVLAWPDDVVALADHLGIARFAVMGVSGGGTYSAACAYKIPERLLACGLVSSAAPPKALKGAFEWTLPYVSHVVARYSPIAGSRVVGALLASQFKRHPEEVLKRLESRNQGAGWSQELQDDEAAQAPLLPVMREIITEPWRQGSHGYPRDSWLSAHAWGFPLEDIRMPVHLWHGELDVMSPMRAARYLASHIPRCQSTYFPDARHDLFKSHSREILTALLAAADADRSAQES